MSTRTLASMRDIPRFRLSEFLGATGQRRFDYRAGGHVTILAPTDWGKTHLAHELIDATAKPTLPAISLVLKPRDKTVAEFNRRMGVKRYTSWPPPPGWPWVAKPRGYSVWPRSTGDSERDDQVLYYVMREALRDAYRQGGRGHSRIVFADETAGLIELPTPNRAEQPIERSLVPLWTRGRSLGVGMWAATQRPVDIPLHAYSQAQHLFLGNDPDARGRQRFGEIGGIDPALVRDITSRLEPWHWLYIRRKGPRYCIITPG